MIVNVPPSLESFCGGLAPSLTKPQKVFLPAILTGILLLGRKRTQAALAGAVATVRRDPSSVSRRMRKKIFRTRDVYRAAAGDAIRREAARAKPGETWFVPIDGVYTQRGSETRIENAIQYRKKKKGAKGRSTKAHCFVQGLIITPRERIPTPRKSYYTKAYVKRQNKRRKLGRRTGKPLVYKTQVDLAVLIVKELRDLGVPESVEIVVVADELFEGNKLTTACRRLGYTYVAPVDSRRCFADPKRPDAGIPGSSLQSRGKRLSRSVFRKLVLTPGEEDTASHRRYCEGVGSRSARHYRVAHERRAVAKLGEVGIVYSWKRRTNRAGRLTRDETYKVLVCSDPEKLPAWIVEAFELRWQVEIFFRELKSELGLEDYQGTDFGAFERHVDLVLLGFLFLEERRIDLRARTRSRKERGRLVRARTAYMRRALQAEADANDLEALAKMLRSREGRGKLLRLLPKLRLAG